MNNCQTLFFPFFFRFLRAPRLPRNFLCNLWSGENSGRNCALSVRCLVFPWKRPSFVFENDRLFAKIWEHFKNFELKNSLCRSYKAPMLPIISEIKKNPRKFYEIRDRWKHYIRISFSASTHAPARPLWIEKKSLFCCKNRLSYLIPWMVISFEKLWMLINYEHKNIRTFSWHNCHTC